MALRKEWEPPELKHLSRGRKRNQNGIPPVAASEKGKVQTELHAETHGECRVVGPTAFSLASANWKKMGWNPRVQYLGMGAGNWKAPTSKTKYVSRPIAH